MRHVTRALSLAAFVGVAVLGSAASHGSPARTVLAGRLADAVTDAGIAGATVRLGPAIGVTAADGSFRLESSARGRRPYPTTFEAPGYMPYSTWTPVGADERGNVFLFPTRELTLPGYETKVSARLFRDHFSTVYRNRLPTLGDAGGEKLARWTEQPEIVVVNRVMEVVREDGRKFWRATEERLGARNRRRLTRMIEMYTGPLTGGRYSGEAVTLRRLRTGQEVEIEVRRGYAANAGRSEVVFYAFGARENTHATTITEGDVIVSGVVTYWKGYLRFSPESPASRNVTHEYGHTLGMNHHFHGIGPSVPLCSLMGNSVCRPERHVTELDEIIARMAYSRLPGNDEEDRDPRPDSEPEPSAFRLPWADLPTTGHAAAPGR